MSWPGPREVGKPSPPYAGDGGGKKLTKVGKALKKKVQGKLKSKIKFYELVGKLQKEDKAFISSFMNKITNKYKVFPIEIVEVLSSTSDNAAFYDSTDNIISLESNYEIDVDTKLNTFNLFAKKKPENLVFISKNDTSIEERKKFIFNIKKQIKLFKNLKNNDISEFNPEHSHLNFLPSHKEQLKATLLHELGHAITIQYNDNNKIMNIFKFLGGDLNNMNIKKLSKSLSKYYTTTRSRDNWKENLAESFVLYESGHHADKVHPRMKELFKEMEKGNI